MAALLQELTQIGEVTLVRYVGETMWITFRDGQSALTAVQKSSVCVCGITLHFKLKTENWVEEVEREIALCTTNTVPLCDYQPTATTTTADYNCLGIPKVPPQRPKSPQRPSPPTRPPLPKSSPSPSPKHVPKAGVISVIPEMLGRMKIEPPMMPVESEPCTTHEEQQSTAIYEEINDDNFVSFSFSIHSERISSLWIHFALVDCNKERRSYILNFSFQKFILAEYPNTTRTTTSSTTIFNATTRISTTRRKCLRFRCDDNTTHRSTTHSTHSASTTSSITIACTTANSQSKWSTTTVTDTTKSVERMREIKKKKNKNSFIRTINICELFEMRV